MSEPAARSFALVVGHDQHAKGAFGGVPLHMYEYDYNSEIAKKVQFILTTLGVRSQVFYRDSIGIAGVYKLINEFKPEGVIELHFNAANGLASGTETLYSDKIPESKILAEIMQSKICSTFARKGLCRGVKQTHEHERGDVNVHLSDCPSCLVEPFFGDNVKDATMALSKKSEYVQSLVGGILSFLKINEVHSQEMKEIA